MTTHLRPTQLAAYLDLAPQKISQLRARGIITPEADGSYEAEVTRIAYIRHLRTNVVPAASATLTEERAKLLRAVNAGSNVPKCAEVKILSWAGFSVISRLDGDRWLRFLVADRGGAAVPELAS